MQQFPTEDDPLTIPCEFCNNGYYDNGGNDVKCDHCNGSGEISMQRYEPNHSNFYDLDETPKHLEINHKHFVNRKGEKIFYYDDKKAWFHWIECSCGLTGSNEGGKINWNESNYCERLGRTIRK